MSTTKQPIKKEMVHQKSWQEFRDTGLFYFINTILHAFGWALVFQVENNPLEDEDKRKIISVFPSRVSFRGFEEKAQDEEHLKIAEYLAKESKNFPTEVKTGKLK